MAKQFFTVLTNYGTQLIASAVASKQPVKIASMAVGDGGGVAVEPKATKTKLVNEVYRAPISAISVDSKNNKQVIFELTVPEHVGGFYIREMGIFDSTDNLVAIANCPESYKPKLESGSGKIQILRMIITIHSSDAITLTVDDSVIFITRQQFTPKTITALTTNGYDETGHSHKIDLATTQKKGIVKLTSEISDAEDVAATPKAVQKALVAAQNLTNYIPNSKKSNAVNSASNDTVATSSAVKTAYDKGVEAKTAANKAQQSANVAQRSANNAKATADNAKATADNAQRSANVAQQSANNAKATADNAKATADKAQQSANNAQTAADKAQTAADKAQRTAEVKAPVANPIFTTDKTYMDMDTIPSGTLFFRINERAANQPDNTYGHFDAQAWQFDVGDQKTQFIIYNDSDMKVRYKDDGQRWTSWNTMLTSKNLSDSVTNSARDIPASVGGVKIAYDRAVEAEKKGLPTGAVLGFAKGVTPTGFLKCDGTIFNRHTYPDLYRALGNKNTLPNLQRSDVGMLAYFPHDNIPAGWLPCDGESVTQAQYPELYRYLGNKYGANGKLPEAGDRFIRNAGAGLAVGTLQNDAIKTHEIQVPDSSTLGRNAGVFHYAERGGAHNSEYNILTYKGEKETRPKAIAFKLCIKAKNTFDDVIFWIKAFGEVQNAGVLDAGRIAQDLQDKADRRHTHTTGDITNFSHEVTALLKPVRKDYNRTVTLTKKLFDDTDDDWELEQRNINVTGNVTSYSDGCIEQFFHYKNFRMLWFDMEERGKGDHMGYIIPCQLWTAMPKKVTKVHVQFIRRVADTTNAISYRDEAGEWQYAWAYYKQDGNKSQIWINASRLKGGSDEHMDMLIWVEGY